MRDEKSEFADEMKTRVNPYHRAAAGMVIFFFPLLIAAGVLKVLGIAYLTLNVLLFLLLMLGWQRRKLFAHRYHFDFVTCLLIQFLINVPGLFLSLADVFAQYYWPHQ